MSFTIPAGYRVRVFTKDRHAYVGTLVSVWLATDFAEEPTFTTMVALDVPSESAQISIPVASIQSVEIFDETPGEPVPGDRIAFQTPLGSRLTATLVSMERGTDADAVLIVTDVSTKISVKYQHDAAELAPGAYRLPRIAVASIQKIVG